MSLLTTCQTCKNLEACKELESKRLIDGYPLYTPLGWLIKCPDGWREKVLAVELQPLLEQGALESGERQYMPRSKREQQIAALLEDDGPLPSYVVARRIGLHFNTTRAIMCKMFKRGDLDREQRGRVHWYAPAA